MRDWTTAACIASGPSLTEDDCDLIRQSGIPTIVTNNTVKLCLWADVLYAMDRDWWIEYPDLHRGFKGRKCTAVSSSHAERMNIHRGDNSGHGAISLAARFGARRIILLGYDCQYTGGKRHWHGDHKRGLGNANTLGDWPTGFSWLAADLKKKDIQIINCTRETALTCFPREELGVEIGRFGERCAGSGS